MIPGVSVIFGTSMVLGALVTPGVPVIFAVKAIPCETVFLGT